MPLSKTNSGKTRIGEGMINVRYGTSAGIKHLQRMFIPSKATTARVINTHLKVTTVRPLTTVRSKTDYFWKHKNESTSRVFNNNGAVRSITFKRVDVKNAQGKPKAKLVWVPKRN